jgi:DNA-binding response OmpR family regulator
MASIFLLEDEIELREELAAFFATQGHQVIELGSIAEFRSCYGEPANICDIALIDRGLPDGDGLDLVSDLRKAQALSVGIIIFTARGGSDEKIKGFTGGVDHYIVKPTNLSELGAIVNALLKRLPQVATWELSLLTHELTPPKGPSVPLTTMELAFVKMLAKADGQPVSRKDIVTSFGEDYLQYDQNRLDTMVRRLRQKFLAEAGVQIPVKTVRTTGFIFSAPTQILC